ncbi:MAG: 50S ribosomal protein L28 [Thermotogaceae bacterium]|nr:50S ribosomal protein L28 [Thermotogaceae bacterium]
MAKRCEICGKGPRSGNNVSHSNKKSSRWFKPNIQRVKVILPDGTVKRMNVCTDCLRSGKVKRYTRAMAKAEVE